MSDMLAAGACTLGILPAPVRSRVFGVEFTPLSPAQALAALAGREPAAPFAFMVTPNAQHVVQVNRDPARWGPVYHEAAWLCLCDSQIVHRLAALGGTPLPLCTGSDLTAALFEHGLRPDDSLTIIGCEPEVVARLRARWPALRICHHNPPMGFEHDEAAMLACIHFVERHSARYVFIAVGSPRSELLAARIAARGLASGVGLCIGSSLHFLTGARQRAPIWVRRSGLEWLHRLVLEPRRMWRRVFLESLPLFRYALPEITARRLGLAGGAR